MKDFDNGFIAGIVSGIGITTLMVFIIVVNG
jgi:hypothetical protein